MEIQRHLKCKKKDSRNNNNTVSSWHSLTLYQMTKFKTGQNSMHDVHPTFVAQVMAVGFGKVESIVGQEENSNYSNLI